jgi:MFS family permease
MERNFGGNSRKPGGNMRGRRGGGWYIGALALGYTVPFWVIAGITLFIIMIGLYGWRFIIIFTSLLALVACGAIYDMKHGTRLLMKPLPPKQAAKQQPPIKPPVTTKQRLDATVADQRWTEDQIRVYEELKRQNEDEG